MADYISRTALLKRIATQKCDVRTSTCKDCDIKTFCVYDVVETFPAADVAPVRHGKWLNTHHTSIVKCSLCGGTVATLWKGYFCQNCGAKMDGGFSHE